MDVLVKFGINGTNVEALKGSGIMQAVMIAIVFMQT